MKSYYLTRSGAICERLKEEDEAKILYFISPYKKISEIVNFSWLEEQTRAYRVYEKFTMNSEVDFRDGVFEHENDSPDSIKDDARSFHTVEEKRLLYYARDGLSLELGHALDQLPGTVVKKFNNVEDAITHFSAVFEFYPIYKNILTLRDSRKEVLE